MNSGELCARLYSTGQPVRLRWRESLISQVESVATPRDARLWVAPALVDLQVNGFAGVDFQKDNITETELLTAAQALHRAGCGQFLVTLITDEWEQLMGHLRHLRSLRAKSAHLQTAIAGWHLEGPFLSAEPGFCGAHNPEVMCDPSAHHIDELRAVTGTDPVLLTLAPERPGALAGIALATSLGMKVSLGHTNASDSILREAVRAGATGFTHLGNACPQSIDRHDNILWRVLDTPGLTVSLICDGLHVSPALFRLVHRALPPESIYYTTDAMAAAGAPPGRYSLGDMELEVGPDQIVRQPGRTNFAGSALDPIDGIFRAARMLNRPWQEVWDFFSAHPARFMKWEHGIGSGRPATFNLLRFSEEDRLQEVRVFVQGEEVCHSSLPP